MNRPLDGIAYDLVVTGPRCGSTTLGHATTFAALTVLLADARRGYARKGAVLTLASRGVLIAQHRFTGERWAPVLPAALLRCHHETHLFSITPEGL